MESGDTTLSGGYVDLNTSPSVPSAGPQSVVEGEENTLKSTMLFQQLKSVIATGGAEFVNKVRAIYLWNITKDGKIASQWSMLNISYKH